MAYEIIIVIIIGLMWATVGVIFSKIAKNSIDFINFMTCSTLITSITTWIILPKYHVLTTPPPQITALIIVMFLTGMISAFGMTAMHRGMQMGHHGVTWVIGQSALVIPFILGILIWGDKVRLINIIGLLAIITELILLGAGDNSGDQQTDKKNGGQWLLISLLSLLFLGIQQTTSSIPSRWINWHDTANLRLPIYMIGSFSGYAIVGLWQKKSINFSIWRPAILLSLIIIISNLLLFKALDIFASNSRAALVYPLAIGICTSAFAIYSIAIIKEKTSIAHIVGIILGCAGIILIALR